MVLEALRLEPQAKTIECTIKRELWFGIKI
jgi:hypothetical protein